MRARLAAWTALVVLVTAGCSASGGGDARPPGDLTLVSLNVLHGAACPPDSDGCRLPDRVALLMRLVEDAGCPDVVALQEVSPRVREEVERHAGTTCGGRYREAWVADTAIDRELVLTSLEVERVERRTLAGGMRTALWVALRAPIGDVQLVVTHVGAGGRSDGTGGGACLPRTCPPPCDPAGTPHQCQVTQVGALLDEVRGDDVALVVGDFNLVPTAPPLRALLAAHDLVDAYLAAGNPECDPSSGEGCTGGRDDTSVAALSDPAARETERIDYAFVAAGDACEPELDGPADADGDGAATGLFAARPATNGPGGLVWPSDHAGVSVDLSCAEG